MATHRESPRSTDNSHSDPEETKRPELRPLLPSFRTLLNEIGESVVIEPEHPASRIRPSYVPGSQIEFAGKPVAYYGICGSTYIMQRAEFETTNQVVRTTASGRRLRYKLNVMQEPAKARACGSGPRCKLI
jgi:hypothetical protein